MPMVSLTTRYDLALVQRLSASGGYALNYARVTDFMRDTNRKISGVRVEDHQNNNAFTVNAKAIINATGIFSDSIRQLANPSLQKRIRPSKGAHILLPLDRFPTEDALLIPKTEDGRVLFAIRWQRRLLVGTTDEEVSPDAELVVTKEDVEYLLRHLNQYIARPASRGAIVSGFAGARPLVSCPGDFVSTNASPGIGISPAKRFCQGRVGANVFPQFAGQVGYRGENAPSDDVALDLRKPQLHLI